MSVTMLYDGNCLLCQQSLRMVQRLDWDRHVEALDLQAWSAVQQRFPQLSYEVLMGAIHVITPQGAVLVGYEGMREIARWLPLTKWLHPLLGWPVINWVGPKLYALVARNRYRLNRLFGNRAYCADGACKIP